VDELERQACKANGAQGEAASVVGAQVFVHVQMTPQLQSRQRLQGSQPQGSRPQAREMLACSWKQSTASGTASARQTTGSCMAMQRPGVTGTGTQTVTGTAAAGERATGVAAPQVIRGYAWPKPLPSIASC
jgi:hypothetical protein